MNLDNNNKDSKKSFLEIINDKKNFEEIILKLDTILSTDKFWEEDERKYLDIVSKEPKKIR